MLAIANLIVLFASIKLLQQTHKPLYPALVYTGVSFIFRLTFGGEIKAVLIGTLIGFVLAFIYFWLLNLTEGSIFWWIILVLGVFVGLV